MVTVTVVLAGLVPTVLRARTLKEYLVEARRPESVKPVLAVVPTFFEFR